MPSIRISDFDTWRPGYGLASVRIVRAATSNFADVFEDEDLTIPAANPQTLLERTLDGVSYGKFAQPVYTAEPFQLEINTVDGTGIVRPGLTTLEGVDASLAHVTVSGGAVPTDLAVVLARTVNVADYGEFKQVGAQGASAATNNATLVSAIGVAGAAGGGFVEIPAGTYAFNALTIPQGVVLRGKGRVATTLQSTFAGNVITIGGDRAGFSRLTMDGVSQVGSSVGVYALGKDQQVFDDVEVKRFAVGCYLRGVERVEWDELFISDCVDGIRFYGDTDATSSGDGKACRFVTWRGGKVELCSGIGAEIKHVDATAANITMTGIGFDTNTGTALKIIGATSIHIIDPDFLDNTVALDISDNETVSPAATVIDFLLEGGRIDGGDINLEGALETVIFRRVEITDVDATITTPGHNIIVDDGRENGVTLSGIGTAWVRQKTADYGASSGITTGNAATKAWAITLEAGQCVYLEGKVIGRQRNGTDSAFYHIAVSARRPGASLAYDTQTANFTVGDVLTGATSGATARIIADSDGGATGTLTLQDLAGDFVDNEIITDGAGGSATANGTQSYSNAALLGSVTAIRAAQETDSDYDATFVANGPEIELRVTGDTSKVVEWIADVHVVSS